MATLLEMSFYGGLFIAAIILLRSLALNRLPKAAFLVLWTAAFLRLSLPFHIPSPFSIYSAANRLNPLPRRAGLLQGGGETATVTAAKAALSPWLTVWAVGAVLLAVALLALHLRSRRRYMASLPLEYPFIKTWLEKNRLRRPVQVRRSDQIESPLTYGVLWPVILLPKGLDLTDEKRLAFILAHELSHIRHFHVFFKWLLAALLCVHWFNPLVWAMYLLANRDLELSCDEAVLKQYGLQARSSYAMALVELEERRSSFLPLASSFSKNALTERITAIMKSRPVTAVSVAAALVLVGAAAGAFLTSAAEEQRINMTRSGSGTADSFQAARGMGWRDEEEFPSAYTREQIDRLIAALKPDGYESLSIAAFNRMVHSALNEDMGEDLFYLYENILGTLPEDDENAAFLRNTVQASMEEYDARMREVTEGKEVDPEFYGYAQITRTEDVFGDQVEIHGGEASYSFTYRILDQEKLTVGQRDAFLQSIMQAAQDYLSTGAGSESGLQTALEQAGLQSSNEKIRFTGCEVIHYMEFDRL